MPRHGGSASRRRTTAAPLAANRFRVRRWLALFVLGATACAAERRASERPDIVLVSLDTLRADHLSLYGYGRETSPRLDRFAAEHCRVFEGSLASSTWTLPSHATMFTGVLPNEHGVTRLDTKLPVELPTVAGLLRDSGYTTSAVTDGGFLAPLWGLERGFTTYSSTAGQPWDRKDARGIFQAASDELDRLRKDDAPFLLFVHTLETHQPYENREGFAAPFLDRSYDGPFEDDAALSSRFPGVLPAAEARRIVDLYDGEIRRLDHYLNRFLERAWDRQGNRDLYLVITSDHGEAFGEHGSYEHGLGRVDDENVVVPLLLCGRRLLGASRSKVETSTLDLAPTVLELAATIPPRPLLGRSLLSVGEGDVRWAFSHGFNSLPALDEEWLRLQGAGGRLTVNLRKPPAPGELTGDETLRARALLALARGRGGDRLVLLPQGLDAVRWSRDPGFSVAAALDDGSWRFAVPSSGADALPLDPRAQAVLLLRGAGLAAGMPFRIEGPGWLRVLDRELDSSPIAQLSSFLEGAALPRLVAFEAGLRFRTRRARIDDLGIQELKALGYL